MRSQGVLRIMRLWCERSEAALFDPESENWRILCGRSATTSRGVLEAYSSQKPQSATVRLSMWKGALMRRERPNNDWGNDVLLLYLVRFLNRTFQNAEIRCSVWKQTEAHWSIAEQSGWIQSGASVRSDCEFGDMKGVLISRCELFPKHTTALFTWERGFHLWGFVDIIWYFWKCGFLSVPLSPWEYNQNWLMNEWKYLVIRNSGWEQT